MGISQTTAFDAKALPIIRGRSPGFSLSAGAFSGRLGPMAFCLPLLLGLQLRDSPRFARGSLFAARIWGGTLMMITFQCTVALWSAPIGHFVQCGAKVQLFFVIGKKELRCCGRLAGRLRWQGIGHDSPRHCVPRFVSGWNFHCPSRRVVGNVNSFLVTVMPTGSVVVDVGF